MSRLEIVSYEYSKDQIKRAGTMKIFKKKSQSGMVNHAIVQFLNKYLFVL